MIQCMEMRKNLIIRTLLVELIIKTKKMNHRFNMVMIVCDYEYVGLNLSRNMKRKWRNHNHNKPNYLLHYGQWTSSSSSFRSKSQSRLCLSRSSKTEILRCLFPLDHKSFIFIIMTMFIIMIFMSLVGSLNLSWCLQKNIMSFYSLMKTKLDKTFP